MCLYSAPTATTELLERMQKNKTNRIRAWKIVRLKSDTLHSKIYSKTWHAGVNKSNSRRRVLPNYKYTFINNGIHVYLNEPKGRDVWLVGGETVLEVWCHADDLIAAAHKCSWKKHQAVFMKVEVTKGAIERAIEKLKTVGW